MQKKLLALTAVLGIAALASSVPNAEAATYCSVLCPGRPLDTACVCPPGTDKEGSPSTCENWNSIAKGGCWYE